MNESIARMIEREVGAWPGVDVEAHQYGGLQFRVHHHEIGHLHGDELADLPFPVRMREQLVKEGRADAHAAMPETGWVSRRIGSAADVSDVVELFRLNYQRIVDAEQRKTTDAVSSGSD